MMAKILIIEDDEIMAECIARATRQALSDFAVDITILNNAISAMTEIDRQLPDLILLDILLIGPNGFSLLNELISYADTATIPVIVVSSLDFNVASLATYGVKSVLQKSTMTPAAIQHAVREALHAE